MITSFANLQLSQEELVECHRAFLMRFIVESALRREQGLEPIDEPPILAELERLLSIDEQASHQLFHQMEDELWAYSWYMYTDEWAWFCAKREVRKRLGAQIKYLKPEELEELIQQKYREQFEEYVSKISMENPIRTKSTKRRQKKLKDK